MKHVILAVALLGQLLQCTVSAQYIDVPNGSYTNALPLGTNPLTEFGLPGSPAGYTPPTVPSLSTNFSATGNNLYSPPDTMGAVGTNRLMVMVNVSWFSVKWKKWN